MKKGAIELSMSFLVVLIISIVIFGFGIRFIYTLTKQANDLQSMSASDIDSRISSMVCEGNSKVCIGIDRKTIPKTDFDVFGIKIVNVADNENFEIETSVAKGITKTGAEFNPAGNLELNPSIPRPIKIEKNSEGSMGLGVGVNPNAVSGTYILNVEIKNMGRPNELYVPIQKLYVDVP